ncbi:hypothetical protein Tco_1561753 [Tanacetum coccineum]
MSAIRIIPNSLSYIEKAHLDVYSRKVADAHRMFRIRGLEKVVVAHMEITDVALKQVVTIILQTFFLLYSFGVTVDKCKSIPAYFSRLTSLCVVGVKRQDDHILCHKPQINVEAGY